MGWWFYGDEGDEKVGELEGQSVLWIKDSPGECLLGTEQSFRCVPHIKQDFISLQHRHGEEKKGDEPKQPPTEQLQESQKLPDTCGKPTAISSCRTSPKPPQSHPQTPNTYEEKGETGSKHMRSPFLWGCEWCKTLWRSQRCANAGRFWPREGGDIPWTRWRTSAPNPASGHPMDTGVARAI